MKVVNVPKVSDELIASCRQFFKEGVNIPDDIIEEGLYLGGSWSKGTSNEDSDVDLILYYSYDMESFFRMERDSVTFNANKVEIRNGSGTCFYKYKDEEYEMSVQPIYTTTDTAKDLVRGIYKQNADYMFKFVKSVPVETFKRHEELRRKVLDEYHWDKNAMFGYFHGYMASQLLRHKRRVDAEQRRIEALSKNSALPLVKLTIDGVYICLNGISILEDQEIVGDYKKLYEKYQDMFTKEQNEYLEECYNRKVYRTAITTSLGQWVNEAIKSRDEIFELLNTRIHESKEKSTLPELSKIQRKENADILDEYLLEVYS